MFASFLENCKDIISYAKNYFAVNFKLDYVNADGDISNYYPDFFVKVSRNRLVIVETKGLEDLDVPLKEAKLEEADKYVDYIFSLQAFENIEQGNLFPLVFHMTAETELEDSIVEGDFEEA